MTSHLIALDKVRHNLIKIKQSQDFNQVKNQNMSPISANELANSATSYPVFFIKDQDTGLFKLIALFGLEAGENLFYRDGKWLTHFVPNNILRYPFTIGRSNTEQNTYSIFIDESSERVNETEGLALYNEDKSESDFLIHINNLLKKIVEDDFKTTQFINKLNELDLISPYTLTINKPNNETLNIDGLYAINQNQLNNLNESVIVELHKTGYFAAIYGQLISISQVNNLINLKFNR